MPNEMIDLDKEFARIKELKRYDILDTPPDGAFDDITQLASTYFNVPIAIVSLVDEDRVWFKSAHGLKGVTEINRGPGLCASAIMHNGLYIAEDLRSDPNSLANPLVAKENGFRFYAAAPLRTPNGHALGTICLLDTVPRSFSDNDRTQLEFFGRLVMGQMEYRLASREIASLAFTVNQKNEQLAHAANHDALTGLLNRRSINNTLAQSWKANGGHLNGALLILDVDRFKSINDVHGHPAGDAALVAVAEQIRSAVRSTDYVGRYGGEEFIVILNDCDVDVAHDVAERIRLAVESGTVQYGDITLNVTISGGLCYDTEAPSIEQMLKAADEALYVAKNSGRNRIVLAHAH